MQDSSNFVTLIFMVIAVIVFLRLRSVLGTRTGHEKKRDSSGGSPLAKPRASNDKPRAANDSNENIIPMRPTEVSRGVTPPDLDENTLKLKRESEVNRIVGKNTDLREGLEAIMAKDKDFSPKQFIEGGRAAYEMIVVAFAANDKKALKPLLDKDVYDSFVEVMDARQARDETVDFTFVGFNGVTMIDAGLDSNDASIGMHFKSQIISATRNADGDVVEGDEITVQEISDEWTFARSVRARNPNWKLVATNAVD